MHDAGCAACLLQPLSAMRNLCLSRISALRGIGPGRCLAGGRNSEEGADSFPGEGRIDPVFVTPDLAPRVTHAWIGHGTPASDHWPVFVELAQTFAS